MSFSETFREPALLNSRVLRRFAALLEPKSAVELEALAGDAEKLTRQNFGRTMRLFAPLYLSNECVNVCKYCGFSRDNPILRVTLSVDQVEAEARHLWRQGFRNVLLVAGRASEIRLVRLPRPMRRAAEEVHPRHLAGSGADGNRRLPARRGRRGRGDWSFIRRRTIARPTRSFIPRDPRGTSIGGSTAPNAPTQRDSAGSASARCSGLPRGRPKRFISPRMSITCCAIAGRRRSPSRCRGCGRRRASSNRGTSSTTARWCRSFSRYGSVFHRWASCSRRGKLLHCATGSCDSA